MQIFTTEIEGIKVLQPKIFNDDRGLFFESHNHKIFKEYGINADFVQDNESHSKVGVLRGMHFQRNEHAQAKLIRVIKGEVLDVAVDLRRNSPTLGKHFSIILNAENKQQLFIPRGFAHGFVALSDHTITQYKCDNYYNKEAEAGIIYNDSSLAIDWKLPASLLRVNERDANFPTLKQYLNEYEHA